MLEACPGRGRGGRAAQKIVTAIWLQVRQDRCSCWQFFVVGKFELASGPGHSYSKAFAQGILFMHFMDVCIDLSCAIAFLFAKYGCQGFSPNRLLFVRCKASLPRTITKPLHACFCFSSLHRQQKISKHKCVTKTRHAAGARRRHGVSGQP